MYALHEVPHERVLSQHTERSHPTEFDLIGTILKWRHNLTPGRVKSEGKGANKVSPDSEASCFMLRETLYLTWWVEQRPKQKSQERARPAQPHVLWKWFSRSLKIKRRKYKTWSQKKLLLVSQINTFAFSFTSQQHRRRWQPLPALWYLCATAQRRAWTTGYGYLFKLDRWGGADPALVPFSRTEYRQYGLLIVHGSLCDFPHCVPQWLPYL